MDIADDESYFLFKSKEPVTVDMVGEISPEKISKLKKSLFEFFLLISSSWVKKNLTKIRNILAYCGIGFKQLQFQSLVLLSTTKKQSSYYDRLVESILNYIRFDLCFIQYTSQVALNSFCLSVIFLMVFIFLVVFFQIYTKKRIMTKVFVVIFGSLIWVIENYLMIPVVIYSTIYIKHSWLAFDDFVSVYDRNLVFDYKLGIFFLLQLIFLYILLILNTIFNYTSAYSYETAYSRAHSVVSLKQISFLFFLSMAHILVSKLYFLYISILVGIFMVYNYLYYMPYYSNFDNLVDSGLWTTLTVSSILSLVNEFMPGGFETVICLALMLPFIYFILWTKLKENLNKRSNLADDSPYISELKIRKLCYMKKEINESTIQEIRELFNEYTKRFIEFKLLFIWECNFELKYSPSSALAMMKLLKSVFAEKRPDFLKKPKNIFKSFPDIESQFFYYKLYKKINESNGIKDFSLLKYLKNYSKSNKLDYQACRKLINLIDCNLESLRYNDKEIAKKVLEFSEAIQVKDSTLSRYLKKYNDESDYLSQYKNFKEQLFYSNDPNSKSQQDKRRESFIDKLMGFNSEQKVAKLIISGSPKEVGKIIYLNRNCLDLLGANSSAEVLGRNFTFIIPAPYDHVHCDILQKFLLFGQKTDLRRNHLIITDIEGYSLEVSMHMSIAFHSQVPYFVLDLVPKSPKECIAFLDQDGKILCFSEELNMIIKPNFKYIQELLPCIDKYFERYSTNQCFFYQENGTNELLKRVEIDIDKVKFNILYFFEDECSFKFNHQLHNIPIRFSRQNSILIKSRTRESEGIRSKKSSFVKRKVRTNEVVNDKIRVKLSDNSSKIEKFSSILLLSQKIIFCSLAVLVLAFTISEMSITDNQKLCEIMNKIGLIRFSLTEISKNTRSAQLNREGVETFYDFNTYLSLIVNSSELIEESLDDLKSYSKVYPIITRFKDFQLVVTRYLNGNYLQEPANLYQSLLEVSTSAKMLVNSNFSDEVSLFFIYNNCFQRIFSALNSSGYKNLEGMMMKSSYVYEFIRSIKSILFIPLFILAVLSVAVLIVLEKVNIQQWEAISNISTTQLQIIRSKAIERVKNIHSNEEILDAFVTRKAKLYCKCWKRYVFCTALLCSFVILYYIVTANAIEKPLSYIIHMKLNHRFWGGLRRSLLSRSFIWARESQMAILNHSYFNLITDYVSLGSFSDFFEKETNLVLDIQKYDYLQSLELKAMDLDYGYYFNYMSKDGCLLSATQNCSLLAISKGIHLAILGQLNDLHTLIDKPLNPSLLKNLEFNNNLLLASIKLANKEHESTSNKYFSIFSNYFIVACSFCLCFLLLFYHILQKPSVLSLKTNLLSRNQMILMFQETLQNKSTSLNSTSNH